MLKVVFTSCDRFLGSKSSWPIICAVLNLIMLCSIVNLSSCTKGVWQRQTTIISKWNSSNLCYAWWCHLLFPFYFVFLFTFCLFFIFRITMKVYLSVIDLRTTLFDKWFFVRILIDRKSVFVLWLKLYVELEFVRVALRRKLSEQ